MSSNDSTNFNPVNAFRLGGIIVLGGLALIPFFGSILITSQALNASNVGRPILGSLVVVNYTPLVGFALLLLVLSLAMIALSRSLYLRKTFQSKLLLVAFIAMLFVIAGYLFILEKMARLTN